MRDNLYRENPSQAFKKKVLNEARVVLYGAVLVVRFQCLVSKNSLNGCCYWPKLPVPGTRAGVSRRECATISGSSLYGILTHRLTRTGVRPHLLVRPI